MKLKFKELKMKKLLSLTLLLASQNLLSDDLLNIYDLAVKNDVQLKVASSNRSASYESKTIARAALLPNISAAATYTHTEINGEAPNDSFDADNVSLSLTQPIYRRASFLRLDQADSTLGQADADFTAAEQDLVVRTVTSYFEVLRAQDDLKFVRANLKAIDRQLDQAKQRFEVGLIAITAVYESQARYDLATADEITSINDLDTTWEALYEIILKRPDAIDSVKNHIQLSPPQPNEILFWSGKALKNNPSIQSAKQQTESTKTEIEIQRSGHYPTLDLVATLTSSRSQSATSTDSDNATISLQGALPLYSGGGVSSATRQAEYNYQASNDSLEQIKRSVNKQVKDAFRGVVSSMSRVRALKATVASSQSALDATQAGFDVGTRTIVDVLDTQQALYRSERDYSGSYYDYILQHLRLKLVAGVLGRTDLESVNMLLVNH